MGRERVKRGTDGWGELSPSPSLPSLTHLESRTMKVKSVMAGE
jgi:hypothetical protein